VYDEEALAEGGFNGILAVGGGSSRPPRLVRLDYAPAGASPHLALAGKGITFDSGGLSLKPGSSMVGMKSDMAGAAAVLSAIVALAELEVPVRVTGWLCLAENMPSGTAARPNDVIRMKGGTTVEVLNTDAEGRLVMADALAAASEEQPDAIIDVATLTGACVVALGHHRTAVMSRDDDLARQIKDAGDAADDKAWPLPMAEEYERQLRSNFADFANVGGRDGGAITAACFLGKFTEDMPWAHLDIAGTAWKSGSAKGATGRPVPLLAQLVLGRARALP
jgi:leucyl aminopeptidase